jgi:hypothetical protein
MVQCTRTCAHVKGPRPGRPPSLQLATATLRDWRYHIRTGPASAQLSCPWNTCWDMMVSAQGATSVYRTCLPHSGAVQTLPAPCCWQGTGGAHPVSLLHNDGKRSSWKPIGTHTAHTACSCLFPCDRAEHSNAAADLHKCVKLAATTALQPARRSCCPIRSITANPLLGSPPALCARPKWLLSHRLNHTAWLRHNRQQHHHHRVVSQRPHPTGHLPQRGPCRNSRT